MNKSNYYIAEVGAARIFQKNDKNSITCQELEFNQPSNSETETKNRNNFI